VGALAAMRVFREVSKDRVIVAMIVLAGLGSFFVGSAIQTAMPAIATSMDGASGGTAYGVLLFANGLGGVLGGLLLEGTGWLRLSVRAAMWSTAVYGLSSALFALSHNYLVAALLLVVGGVANLAAMSITQTVVQLLAPREKRGQVVGLYGVAANGLRIGSGFTVGLLGAVFGLRVSLGVSALAMVAGTAVVAGYLALGTRRRGARELAAAQAEVTDAAQRDEVAELPEMP
jgi:MFS family permease